MPEDTPRSAPNFFPELVYDDTGAALDWLSRAFGFVKGVVIKGPDGTIDHAEMHFGAGTIMLEGPLPETEYRLKSPQALGGASQMIYVTVEDPDAHERDLSTLRPAKALRTGTACGDDLGRSREAGPQWSDSRKRIRCGTLCP